MTHYHDEDENELASRSAPEAGKAVVKPLEWKEVSEGGIWEVSNQPYVWYTIVERMTKDGYLQTWNEGRSATLDAAKAAAQADYEQRILSALASPGAEPVAWSDEPTEAMYQAAYPWFGSSFFNFKEMYRAIRLAPPQAVAPAEEIAGLVERLKNPAWSHGGDLPSVLDTDLTVADLREAAAALTSLSAIAEERRSMSLDWKNACERSEAEASDLRRKLEEHERIGKMMANAIFNVHQRGLHVNADDMDSLKECQEAWDRALTTDGGANG